MKSTQLWHLLFSIFMVIGISAKSQSKDNVDSIKINFEILNGNANPNATTMSSFLKWVNYPDTNNYLLADPKELIGLPKQWKNVKIAVVPFDEPQYYYQLIKSRKIDSTTYLKKTERYKNTAKYLTNTMINCYVYVIVGTNLNGQLALIVDANNNKNFNDDQPIQISENPEIAKNGYQKEIAVQLANLNGITNESLPIKFYYNAKGNNIDQISYNFPVYGLAKLKLRDKNYVMKFNSIYSMTLNFNRTQFYITRPDKLNQLPVEQEKFIHLDDEVYEVIMVDIHERALYLKKANNTNISFPKIGFKAPAFQVTNLNNSSKITLETYKGSYLLIDFWATWCPPCLESMLEIKSAFNFLKQKNIAVLGVNIAAKEDIESAKNTISKRDFFWDQAYSDEMTISYKVGAIPANFLIDPNGKIIATDLDLSKLKQELEKFIK